MVGLIGAISYGLAAVAFLLLTLLLVASWRGRLKGALLMVAAVVSMLWATLIAYEFALDRVGSTWWSVIEIARNAAWFAFFSSLLGAQTSPGVDLSPIAKWFPRGLALFCAVLVSATLLPIWFPEQVTQLHYISGIFGRIILAVSGMTLVEFVFRNTRQDQRWGIKFLCLGAGGMFAYDFYLYADAMLFKHIDAEVFAARGIINALIVPLVAVSAARNQDWSLEIAVSRRVIFHSATLLSAGVYLLLMAAAGYYLRFFGGSWGGVLQATFMFGALLLLIVMLASGTLRARARVFLSKHFFSYKFDYREEWLRFTRTLSEGEPGLHLRERSIQAIAQLVESPGGALWLKLDGDAYERAAHWNMPQTAGSERGDGLFANFLRSKEWVVDLKEYKTAPEKYEGLTLPPWLTAIPRASMVVPLMLHEQLLGFVVLAESRGRMPVNWEVSDLLRTAGCQAASYLAQLEAAKALLVARQFESFNRMSAFVVHDLKNLISQLSLLLSNVQKHRNNPAFLDDMIETVENSVEKMQRLLTQLRSGSPAPGGQTIIDLESLLQRVVAAKENYLPKPSLEVYETKLNLRADRERLERIIGHLLQNAIEATPKDGQVKVRLSQVDGQASIEVSDTGRGMTAEFIRETLFQPFETTKSAGMGIGAYEARGYITELGGQLEIDSKVDAGSTFKILLPLTLVSPIIHAELA
ncbi:MAG: XrtA/PEP-CTERM system histidine kinase PrsK [Burkholderiales bacterium]